MTPNDDFELTVADWLQEEARHPMPAHLSEVLSRTSGLRQRPWWSSLERWLPMDTTIRLSPAPRVVWILAILALLVGLTFAAIAIGSLSQPANPFGPGARGTVLYGGADGDIYALDIATNESRPLISGPTLDKAPVLSPDGAKLIFRRQESEAVSAVTMVANADGTDVRPLLKGSQTLDSLSWSPDSSRLVAAGEVNGRRGLSTIGLDGKASLVMAEQTVVDFHTLDDPQWRPNGQEIVFLAGTLDMFPKGGLYQIQADGTGLETIVERSVPGPTQPALSPDGTKVAYFLGHADAQTLHVVDIDTRHDVVIDFAGGAVDQRPHWSPDGTRLVFERYVGETYRLAVGSANGGPVVEIGPARPINTGGSQFQFSADGTRVLVRYESDGSSWVLDPDAGSATQLSEDIVSPITMPRQAP